MLRTIHRILVLTLLAGASEAATLEQIQAALGRLREIGRNYNTDGQPEHDTLRKLLLEWSEAAFLHDSQASYWEIEKQLNAALNSRGLVEQLADGAAYGREGFGTLGPIKLYSLDYIVGRSEYLLLRTAMGTYCGYDYSHYLYRRNKGRWQRVLSLERDDRYDWSGDTVQLVPKNASGDALFLLAGFTQNCTSRFGGFRGRLYDINGFAGGVAVSIGANVDTTVPLISALTFDELLLEYQQVGTEAGNYRVVNRLRLIDGRWQRVGPLTYTPREFAELWLHSPWSQAQQWSPASLRERHGWLLDRSREFPETKRCGAGWVVSYTTHGEDGKPDPSPTHVRVEERGPLNFRITEVSNRAPVGCVEVR
ncbi:MAG: hypothetical protein NTV70_18660 [Acidobacteria bacterium]|nr:hypothetical protein [Acidobacteriota bacterium]